MDNILCVVGPTASGKTALAIELAKELNGEVVSCDSMYVCSAVENPETNGVSASHKVKSGEVNCFTVFSMR